MSTTRAGTSIAGTGLGTAVPAAPSVAAAGTIRPSARAAARRCRRSAAALVLLALAAPARAQQPLTLDQTLQLARMRGRALRAAAATLERSASAVDQARAALRPQVTTHDLYTHNYKEVTFDVAAELAQPVLGLADAIRASSGNPPLDAAIDDYARRLRATFGAPIVLQRREQVDAGVHAVVPFYAPDSRAALASAEHTHAAQEAELAATEADVLLAAAQAFYAAAAADELVLARRNGITVASETLDTAKARLQQGTATTLDTLRAEAALDRANQAAIEAEDVQARAYRTLATLLDTRGPLHVVPPEAAPPEAEPAEGLVAGALQRRPEITFYQRSIDAATTSLQAASRAWSPTLSAFGNAAAFNYGGFAGDNYSWALGVQLDWRPYDGGARAARRRTSLAERHEYEARLELLRDTITDEVVNTRRVVGTRRRALDTALRAVNLSRETLRVVRLQYQAGTALQLELLQAQDSLVSADVAAAQARFDLALADLQLRHDTGRLPASATATP